METYIHDAKKKFSEKTEQKQNQEAEILLNQDFVDIDNICWDDEQQILSKRGQGSFGTVEEKIDLIELKIYAVKSYKNPSLQNIFYLLKLRSQKQIVNNYIQEKYIYQKIEKELAEKQCQYLINQMVLKEKFNDQRREISFEPGMCSLEQFQSGIVKLFKESNLQERIMGIQVKNLKYIFKFGMKLVLDLGKCSIFHSDLKPPNIIVSKIVHNEQQQQQLKVLKVIDLGQSDLFNEKKASTFTLTYFNSPFLGCKVITSPPVNFENKEDRIKNEIFQIVRIFQIFAILGNNQFSQLFYRFDENNKIKLDDLLEIQQYIEQLYSNQLKVDKNFQKILNFIKNQIFLNNNTFSFNELENLISEINEISLEDPFEVCEKFLKNKRKDMNNKYNFLEEFIGLKSYIELKCTQNSSILKLDEINISQSIELADQIVDLFTKINQEIKSFFQQTIDSIKILIILGQGGQGKTLFLKRLQQQIKQDVDSSKLYTPIHFRLSEYITNVNNLTEQILQVINQIAILQQAQIQKNKIIILLDGFDELTTNDQLQFQQLLKEINKNQIIITNIQILFVVTSRESNNLSESEIRNYLKAQNSQTQVYYLCPFNKSQQQQYIEYFIKAAKALNQYDLDIVYYPDYKCYEEQFEKFPVINELVKNPFMMKIIVQILPNIKQQHANNSQFRMTTYNIFLNFVNNWLQSQKQRYQLQMNNNNNKNNNNINSFLQNSQIKKNQIFELQLANSEIAWKIYQSDRLTINFNQLNQFLDELSQQQEQFKSTQQDNFVEQIIHCSPLKKMKNKKLQDQKQDNNFEIEYIHKSIYEFFLAFGIQQDIEGIDNQFQFNLNSNNNLIKNSELFLSKKHVNKEPALIKLIAEQIISEQNQNKILQQFIIQNYSTDDSAKIVKANIMTLLNASKYTFSNCEFINQNFSFAQLTRSRFLNCSFEKCVLNQTDFSYSTIEDCKFIENDLKDIYFGLKILEGHTSFVKSIAYNPQGNYLASGSYDNTVRIWNVSSCKQEIIFEGHNDPVTSVIFDLEGLKVASGSEDKQIIIWCIIKQIQLGTLIGHEAGVTSINYSPDGKQLASASSDCSIIIWNIETFQCDFKLQGHKQAVKSVIYSQNGKILATGSEDQTIKIWSVQDRIQIYELSNQFSTINCICFSPDSQTLAAGSENNLITIWSTDKWVELKSLYGHEREITSISFNPDSKTLASVSNDMTIRIWDIQEGKQIKKLDQENCEEITSVSFSPKGTTLASTADISIRIWRIQQETEFVKYQGHSQGVTAICFSPNNKYLASASYDNLIMIWNIISQKQVNILKGHIANVSSICFSPKDFILASSSFDCKIIFWNYLKSQQLFELTGHQQPVLSICFSNDGNQLSSGSEDNSIILWNIKDQKQLFRLEGHSDKVNSIHYSPDDQYLVSGSEDNFIRIWSVKNQNEIQKLEGHQLPVKSVCFSPNGKTIASASNDNKIVIWNTQSGIELQKLSGHHYDVTSLSFHCTGKFLASGSLDCSIIIWETDQYKEILNIQGHTNYVLSVIFSPDGNLLAGSSFDGSIRIWNFKVVNQEYVNQLKIEKYDLISSKQFRQLIKSQIEIHIFTIFSIEQNRISFLNSLFFKNKNLDDQKKQLINQLKGEIK